MHFPSDTVRTWRRALPNPNDCLFDNADYDVAGRAGSAWYWAHMSREDNRAADRDEFAEVSPRKPAPHLCHRPQLRQCLLSKTSETRWPTLTMHDPDSRHRGELASRRAAPRRLVADTHRATPR